MNTFKSVSIVIILIIAALKAQAALNCQGYSGQGNQIPVKGVISFRPSRTTFSALGSTLVQIGIKQRKFLSNYVFENQHTRCAAGPTLQTSLAKELSVMLFAFNSCDPSQVIPGDQWNFKGTLTVYDSLGAGKSFLIACQQVGDRPDTMDQLSGVSQSYQGTGVTMDQFPLPDPNCHPGDVCWCRLHPRGC